MSKTKKEIKKKKNICSICQLEYEGWGNNAEPINEGRCCDKCNTLVIVARINRIRNLK